MLRRDRNQCKARGYFESRVKQDGIYISLKNHILWEKSKFRLHKEGSRHPFDIGKMVFIRGNKRIKAQVKRNNKMDIVLRIRWKTVSFRYCRT
jgi:hypothetical protein